MDFPPNLADDPYYHLAQTGPYAPVIGAALITMVEPHRGHEHGYNRWYEDDHYNAGAMAFPWMWAGRRYVAPVPYQRVRYPADSAIAQPIEAGKYISIYWITEGQYENHLRFFVPTGERTSTATTGSRWSSATFAGPPETLSVRATTTRSPTRMAGCS